jgi:hypothetical protein
MRHFHPRYAVRNQRHNSGLCHSSPGPKLDKGDAALAENLFEFCRLLGDNRSGQLHSINLVATDKTGACGVQSNIWRKSEEKCPWFGLLLLFNNYWEIS